MPAKSSIIWSDAQEVSDMGKKQAAGKPVFPDEAAEARWWASAEGRAFLKQQSASKPAPARTGSRLVAQLNKAASVQIALRLPALDLEQAREIAARKGIGYQTLLKMLVHEGLQRESRRRD
jgi:predicted DNA binding CopG/RHH family protein